VPIYCNNACYENWQNPLYWDKVWATTGLNEPKRNSSYKVQCRLVSPLEKQTYSGLGRLTVEVLRSHTDTSSSVGIIWMRDQPFTETSTWTTHNIHKIRTPTPQKGFEPVIPASEWPPGSASVQTYQYQMESNSTEEFSRWSMQADLWAAETTYIKLNCMHCTILHLLVSHLHHKGLGHIFQLLHQTSQYKGIWVAKNHHFISVSTHTAGDCGSKVVKVLCFNSEGCWFDPSWCQWIFHWHKILLITLWPWGRLKNEYQEYFLGVKAAGA